MSGEGDHVKERREPVPCRECGRPTWSAAGLCARCRQAPVEPPPVIARPVPPPPVAVSPLRLDPEGRLDEDLSCRECGYNVRGLRLADACPECGAAVELAARPDLLRYASPDWVRKLANGARLVVIGAVGSIGLAIAAWIFMAAMAAAGGSGAVGAAWASAGAVLSIVIVVGAWLLTSPEPGGRETSRPAAARLLARWCVMALVAGVPVDTALNLGGPATIVATGPVLGPGWVLLMASSVTLSAVVLVGYAAGLVHLRRLARRIPATMLAASTSVVLWGLSISQGLWLLLAASEFLFMPAVMTGGGWPTGGAGGAVLTFLLFGSCLGALGFAVFGIWSLVLLFLYAAALRRQATAASASVP